jgi:hypothetical protein
MFPIALRAVYCMLLAQYNVRHAEHAVQVYGMMAATSAPGRAELRAACCMQHKYCTMHADDMYCMRMHGDFRHVMACLMLRNGAPVPGWVP